MTTPTAIKSLQRHETYYIPSADLSIIVENIKFRVHRYFFDRESDFFRARLSLSSPDGHSPGSDDDNAIILEDVTAAEFARFLWVFYNPRYSLYDEATLNDWETILLLSHRWMFPEVKALAIRELQEQKMTHVDRIGLYHHYGVDRTLLIPDYIALCEREQPLTLDEGLKLEMETTLMVAWGREAVISNRLADGSLTPQWLFAMVRDIFAIPPYPATTPIDGDTTMTPTETKQEAPPPPTKDNVNGTNPGASPTTTTTKKKTKQEKGKAAKEEQTETLTLTPTNTTPKVPPVREGRKDTNNHKGGSEGQLSVAEQQDSAAGSGKPIGNETNAVRTENDKKMQIVTDKQAGKDSEASDLTNATSGGVPATMMNSGSDETKTEQTAGTGGTEKLHIQTDSSAKVGSANNSIMDDLFGDWPTFS